MKSSRPVVVTAPAIVTVWPTAMRAGTGASSSTSLNSPTATGMSPVSTVPSILAAPSGVTSVVSRAAPPEASKNDGTPSHVVVPAVAACRAAKKFQ